MTQKQSNWTSDSLRGASVPLFLCIPIMVATIYVIAIILVVLFITYPEDFLTILGNPKLLLDVVSIETRRRWMILTLGSSLWLSKKRMEYSLWKMRAIIKKEQNKQQQQKPND